MSPLHITLYLASKTKPTAKAASDGTFVLTLLAYNPVSSHSKDPWRLIWAGEAARHWWAQHAASLVPGVQIVAAIDLVRPFAAPGRSFGAEIHAAVSSMYVNPLKSMPKSAQCAQTA